MLLLPRVSRNRDYEPCFHPQEFTNYRNVLFQFGIACGVLMIRDPNLFKICPEQSFLNTKKYDSLDYLKNECKIAASWQSVLVTIAERNN